MAASAAPSVSVVGPTTIVRPADAPTGSNSISLKAARNETESAQVVVRAVGEAATNIDVSLVAPLAGAAGSIPSANVTIYREEYVNVASASDGELGGATGRFPDALIPKVDPWVGEARNAFPVTAPTGENRVAWIDVHIPGTQPAGSYTGTIRVTASGTTFDVPITVQVLSWTMPATSSLQGDFDINTNKPCQVHGCGTSAAGWSIISMYSRVALDNRVSLAKPAYVTPTAGAASTAFKQYVQPLMAGTESGMRLKGAKLANTTIYTWCATCAGSWKTEAAAGGFLDRVTFHCDEVGTSVSMWTTCRDTYNQASAQWNATAPSSGSLPLQVTATRNEIEWARSYTASDGSRPFQAIANEVDIVIPVVNRLNDKSGSYVGDQMPGYYTWRDSAPGRKIWSYQSCMSFGCVDDQYWNSSYWNGWPSYAIDQPASEARAMPWLLFSRDITGEYYFETVQKLSTAWTDQFSEGGNGDGTLLYPGVPSARNGIPGIGGTREIPIESIRLKRIRDGREDYEYMTFLRNNGKVAQAKSIVNGLFPTPSSTNVTESQLAGARTALLNEVVALTGGTPDPDPAPPTPDPDPAPTPDPGPAPQPPATSPAPSQSPEDGNGAGEETAGDREESSVDGSAEEGSEDTAPSCMGLVATIVGTEGDDVLVGTARRDVIVAMGGDDVIAAGDGHDVVCAGGGDDSVSLGAGNDVVDLGAGSDVATGGSGADRLNGLAGADVLRGGEGADSLSGGDGGDLLDGGLGVDVIDLGPRSSLDRVRSRDGVRDTIRCLGTRRGSRLDKSDLVKGCASTSRRPTRRR